MDTYNEDEEKLVSESIDLVISGGPRESVERFSRGKRDESSQEELLIQDVQSEDGNIQLNCVFEDYWEEGLGNIYDSHDSVIELNLQ